MRSPSAERGSRRAGRPGEAPRERHGRGHQHGRGEHVLAQVIGAEQAGGQHALVGERPAPEGRRKDVSALAARSPGGRCRAREAVEEDDVEQPGARSSSTFLWPKTSATTLPRRSRGASVRTSSPRVPASIEARQPAQPHRHEAEGDRREAATRTDCRTASTAIRAPRPRAPASAARGPVRLRGLGQPGQDLEHVADDAVVGDLEDRRLGVLVDRHDAAATTTCRPGAGSRR